MTFLFFGVWKEVYDDRETGFSAQLQLLQQAEQQDLSNLFILHGIVHLYQGVFDLAMTVFRDALKRDGFGMSAMGSPKEIIAEAYEQYLFVDESLWLAMIRERFGSEDALDVRVRRILDSYVPALTQLQEEL